MCAKPDQGGRRIEDARCHDWRRRRALRAAARGVAAFVLAAAFGAGDAAHAQEIGPRNGTLVVVGGALTDTSIIHHFVRLAGGPDAPIVVIPTAGGGERYDQDWSGLQMFRDAGATNLTVLHTTDRREADSEEFVEPLRLARAVWISGGRQWRLADAYLDTRVHAELRALLERGGVIGGSSAGATILGSYLVRGDTRTNTIVMGDHETGFGFLKDVAIDQHLLRRNRQFDLIELIEVRPELLGIGIDENTAISVQGDTFEVIGRSYVAIYDNRRMLGDVGHFYLLAPGDRYDLRTREPTRDGEAGDPFARVRPRAWPDRER